MSKSISAEEFSIRSRKVDFLAEDAKNAFGEDAEISTTIDRDCLIVDYCGSGIRFDIDSYTFGTNAKVEIEIFGQRKKLTMLEAHKVAELMSDIQG